MEKHIKTKIEEENNFINKLEIILLGQVELFAMSNRNKFSYEEEFRAKEFIKRVVNFELEYLLGCPLDYYNIYIKDKG